MEGYKCVSCGKKIEPEEYFFQVRIVNGEGNVIYEPTCSETCAEDLKAKYMFIHRRRLDDVMNQVFQKIKAE